MIKCYLCHKKLSSLLARNHFECDKRVYDYILCNSCSRILGRELEKLRKAERLRS